MAEILLSLTIIGVVAAITLPSLTGNINERTWNTQRKALYARISQAISLMPALNGYGTLTEATSSASAVDTTAETFITAGLSKVLKINNICDNEHLKDCGFNEKWTTFEAGSLSLPKTISDLNSGITANSAVVKVPNTKAAAFETINGESILVFYNPGCTPVGSLLTDTSMTGATGYYIKQHVCANFVFDLNGSKGPNTVGKDIGFISAVYPSDSAVVMPVLGKKLGTASTQVLAGRACSAIDKEYRLPNVEEALSLYYNKNLLGTDKFGVTWTSSLVDSENAWFIGAHIGLKYQSPRSQLNLVTCIRR